MHFGYLEQHSNKVRTLPGKNRRLFCLSALRGKATSGLGFVNFQPKFHESLCSWKFFLTRQIAMKSFQKFLYIASCLRWSSWLIYRHVMSIKFSAQIFYKNKVYNPTHGWSKTCGFAINIFGTFCPIITTSEYGISVVYLT